MHCRRGQSKIRAQAESGEVRIKITGQNDPTKHLSASDWNKSTLTPNPRIESRRMEVVITDRSKANSHRVGIFGPTQNQENNLTVGRNSQPSKIRNQPCKTTMNSDQEILTANNNSFSCQPADDRLKWNPVTILTAIERDKKLVALTAGSKSHSTISSRKLIKNGYLNPTQREESFNALVRERKSAGTFSPSLTSDVRPIDSPVRSAPSTTTKSSRYSTSQHSGVWEFNAIQRRWIILISFWILLQFLMFSSRLLIRFEMRGFMTKYHSKHGMRSTHDTSLRFLIHINTLSYLGTCGRILDRTYMIHVVTYEHITTQRKSARLVLKLFPWDIQLISRVLSDWTLFSSFSAILFVLWCDISMSPHPDRCSFLYSSKERTKVKGCDMSVRLAIEILLWQQY